MNQSPLRLEAIKRLQKAGLSISDRAKTPEVVKAIEMLTGRHCAWNQQSGDFLHAYLAPQKATVWMPPFKPMKKHPHPRIAEIECLPKPVSMAGIGNGGNNGMGRGR